MNDTNFERLGEINNSAFFNVNHVFNGKRYFDAIAVIMGSENDLLKCLDPFFGANATVCPEMVDSLIGNHREIFRVFTFLLRICERSGNTVLQVDVPAREVGV